MMIRGVTVPSVVRFPTAAMKEVSALEIPLHGTACRSVIHVRKYEAKGGGKAKAFSAASVYSEVRSPLPGRIVASSDHVKSKSPAVQSTCVLPALQLML